MKHSIMAIAAAGLAPFALATCLPAYAQDAPPAVYGAAKTFEIVSIVIQGAVVGANLRFVF